MESAAARASDLPGDAAIGTPRASSLDMVVLGLGLGLVMQVLALVVQSSVGRGDLGVATSAATFVLSVGGSVSTAVVGAVFTTALSSNLARDLPRAEVAAR